MIYKLCYWEDSRGSTLIEINSSIKMSPTRPDVIKRLWDTYKKNNIKDEEEKYINDWCKYLIKLGYRVRVLKPDYVLYWSEKINDSLS